ncbi:hypothetical protein Pmani_014496 [Petrolisthes manimaculis]|uniref:Calponin-homology (CH) domain-containing protein n=1 Tax=Petrolisthes manimaculis TaxID=1843537 RepID=A0AAE1PVD3_9EUCA|nr:hypothetical protein Pmani_014496 [Petrolisthes manimaculis]
MSKEHHHVMWKDVLTEERNEEVEVREIYEEEIIEERIIEEGYSVESETLIASEPWLTRMVTSSIREVPEESGLYSAGNYSAVMEHHYSSNASMRKTTHRSSHTDLDVINESVNLLPAKEERFTTIIGDKLPQCEVVPSPIRRQTFIASAQEGFRPVQGDTFPTCDVERTPVRRETYVALNEESFKPIHNGKLPQCSIVDSPLRRQTFIKGQDDNMRRLSLHPKALEDGERSRLSFGHSLENSNSSNTSTPAEGTTPALGTPTLGDLEMTPINPLSETGMISCSATRVSCINLLDKLNAPETFSNSPQPPRGQENRKSCPYELMASPDFNTTQGVVESPESDMCTAPGTPLSEYETAPNTPPEHAALQDDFNNTVEFPSPKVNEFVSRTKAVNLVDVSIILQQELTNKMKLESDISADNLDETLSPKEIENGRISPASDVSNVDHHNVRDGRDEGISERSTTLFDSKKIKETPPLPHRLSSGTIIKETSILQSEISVTLDDHHNSCETIIKDMPTFSPSSLPHVSDNHLPRRVSVGDDVTSNESFTPKNNGNCKTGVPVICPVPYQSQALSEILMFKGVTPKKVPDKEDSFIMASVADFSFSPCTDPRRCSTGIKSNLPEDLAEQRRLSDKARQLFDLSVDSTRALQESCNASLAQYLSTIIEEEGTYVVNKTHDFYATKEKLNEISLNKPENLAYDKCASIHLKVNKGEEVMQSRTRENNACTSEYVLQNITQTTADGEKNDNNSSQSLDASVNTIINVHDHLVNVNTQDSGHTDTDHTKDEVLGETCEQLSFVKQSNEVVNVPVSENSILEQLHVTYSSGCLTQEEKEMVSHSESSVKSSNSETFTFNSSSAVSEGNSTKLIESAGEKESGFMFVKISPPHTKRPQDDHPKNAWSKRSRVTPTPAVTVSVTSLKLPPKKKSSRNPSVVSSKCKSPQKPQTLKTGMKPPLRPLTGNRSEKNAKEAATKYPEPMKAKPIVSQNKSSTSQRRGGLKTSTSAWNLSSSRQSRSTSRNASCLSKSSSASNIKSASPSTSGLKSRSSAVNLSATAPNSLSLLTSGASKSATSLKSPATSSSILNNTTSSNSVSSLKSASSTLSVAEKSLEYKRPVMRKSAPLRVFPSKLTLIKTGKTAMVHHPNPYAARNMYYDDRWVEKQVAGFTRWLNFILTPPEEEDTASKVKTVDMGKLWSEASRTQGPQAAPTKEVMSLRAYSARRRLNRLRRQACRFYQTKEFGEVVVKLERAIDKHNLAIRKDRLTHVDLGLKQEMLHLMMCYNPLWLRIGLETVYGELLHLSSNSDITTITHFLINRLLSNPNIAARFAHPTVPHCYGAGYEDALKAFQLKKFLILVLFLDRAKTSRLIDHDPCLFNKQAEYKSSRDILIAFARGFLSGVGDVTKHLGYLGYFVTHKQTVLDEFDYAVTNLPVDLRCGIRLTRVMEMLTNHYSLSDQLRVPAISRLQKVHNVDVVLKSLEDCGCPGVKTNIPAKDIVDGHREQTLALLWTIIFKFQVSLIVSEKRLEEELGHLQQSLEVRAQLDEAARIGLSALKESEAFVELGQLAKKKEETSMEVLLTYLRLWTQFTCANYGLEIDNLTVSFSDGRALCLLLHHYYPDILPLASIKWQTTQNLPSQSVDLDVSMDDSFSEMTYTDTCTREEHNNRRANEKDNFTLFLDKVSQLDGIPILIRSGDMINTIPDEKVTATFLAYLCARLLDLSAEMKAARVIQVAWRKCLGKKRLQQLKIETAAAVTIQQWWREKLHSRRRLEYARAATVLQAHWRRHLAQVKLQHLRKQEEVKKMHHAAYIIQATFRRFLVMQYIQKVEAVQTIKNAWKVYQQRQTYLHIRKSTITVQTYFRAWYCRQKYLKLKTMVISIQRKYREKLYLRMIEKEYKEKCVAAVAVQRWWRGITAEKEAQKIVLAHKASCTITSYLRMCLQRKKYQRIFKAVTVLQANVRRWKCQKEYKAKQAAVLVIQRKWRSAVEAREIQEQYLQMREVTIILQANIRAYLVRKWYVELRAGVVCIQSTFKMWKQFSEYQKLRWATVLIQKRWRLKRERNQQKRIEAAVKIQAFMRGCLARRRWQRILQASVCLQSFCRMWKQRRSYLRTKHAVRTLQKHTKGWLAMKHAKANYIHIKASVLTLQATWRMYQVKKRLHIQYKAAITIQRYTRGYMTWKRYHFIHRSIVVIQNYVRAWIIGQSVKQEYVKIKEATLILQKNWKGYLVRQRIQRLKKAAVILQSAYRMKREHRLFQSKREAAIKVQAYYRAQRKGRNTRAEYIKTKTACIAIQSQWRMYRERRTYKAKRGAALTLQQHYRARCERQQTRSACLILQAWFRMIMTKKQYSLKRKATRTIQQVYRAHRSRKEAVKTFQKQRSAIVIIQSWFRMQRQKQQYLKQKQAVVVLQSHIRAHLAMRVVRSGYLAKVAAATLIQAKVRVWLCHRNYKLERAVITLQAATKGFIVRKWIKKQTSAATTIQTNYRGWQARQAFLHKRWAAVVIQCHFRNYVVTTRKQQEFLDVRKKVIKLQATFRSYLVRKRLKEEETAAVMIQSVWRMHCQRQIFVQQKHAATTIQRIYRDYCVTKQAMIKYNRTVGAIIFLQAHARGFLARKTLREKHLAASCLQAHVKGWIKIKQYKSQKEAAVLIQRHYRAYKIGCRLRNEYLLYYKCIIKAQSYARGFLARQQFKKQTLAAVRIQNCVRTYLARKKYLQVKQATVKIQQQYRLYKMMKIIRHMNLIHRSSAIMIQAAVRGFLTRRKYIQKMEAVVVIQAAIKSWLAQRRYTKSMKSIQVIQKYWRATLDMWRASGDYHTRRGAIIRVQAIWRGVVVRRKVSAWNKAASVIQAHYRGLCQYRIYQDLKEKTTVIQKWWKCIQHGRKIRQDYIVKRSSVIILQSAVRRQLMVRKLMKMRKAAVTIQSSFRGYCQRQRYLKEREAAVKIQCWWKGIQCTQHQQHEYTMLKNSIIMSQAVIRGFLVRRKLSRQNSAVVKIQALIRMQIAQRMFVKKVNSVVLIQKWWKSIRDMQNQQAHYHKIKESVVTLQAYTRGMLVRREMLRRHKAASKIQAQFRCHVCRKVSARNKAASVIQAHYRGLCQYRMYQDLKEKTNVIQKWWKCIQHGRKIRQDYIVKRSSVIILQSAVRRQLMVRKLMKMHKAAVTIQSSFRGYCQRQRYLKEREAALKIQCWWKGIQCTQHQQHEYTMLKNSIIMSQAVIRGFLVRRKLSRQNSAVVKIQALIRMQIAQRMFVKKVNSVVLIQKWWKSIRDMQNQQAHYHKIKESVVTLQAYTRGMLVRREMLRRHKAASKIQAQFRCHVSYKHYQEVKVNAVKIQNWWRSLRTANFDYENYQTTKQSVVTIQAFIRGVIVRLKLKRQNKAATVVQAHVRSFLMMKRYKRTIDAAIIIQRWVRCLSKAKEQQSLRFAAITLQAATRGMLVRKKLTCERMAQMIIAAHYRGWITRRQFRYKVECIQVIQQWWRCKLLTKVQRKNYLTLKNATITVQAYTRGMLVRKRVFTQKKDIIKIQSCVRGWLVRRRYQNILKSVVIVQNWWRNIKAIKCIQQQYITKRRAAITLQAHARGMFVRQDIKRQNAAATVIQAWYRGNHARVNYQRRMSSVLRIQRYWRGAWLTLRARERFIYQRRAATIIQAAWRRHWTKMAVRHVKAAQIIQRYIRGWQARKMVKEKRQEMHLTRVTQVTRVHLAAITIQRWMRRVLMLAWARRQIVVVVKIQNWWKTQLARRAYLRQRSSAIILQRAWRLRVAYLTEKRQKSAAVTIQAAWRGQVARRQMRDKQLQEVRERLRQATLEATDAMRIGTKTRHAISFLVNYKDLKRTLRAVIILDTSTRWSPSCSEMLTEGTSLETLFILLKNSNRSIPHMQVQSSILGIFINLAKYPYAAPFIHKLDGIVETVMHLMTVYSEKGPDIFNKCCTLLYIFFTSSVPHMGMQDPKVLSQLKNLKSEMLRRKKVSTRGRRPVKHVPLPVHLHPSTTPDWELKSDGPREFDEPFAAIFTLLHRLCMKV